MSTPATSTDSKTPREIGREMLRLREHFNLTPQEVAERIHIRPRYITAMEEGRYDQMPGKVYARGYIQTYAEFLGMDATKTIAQCFAGEPLPSAQPVTPSASTRANTPARTLPYGRMAAATAVVAIGAVLLSGAMNKTDTAVSETPVSTVAPVPEAMLASMRNVVMPTAANYACLTDETNLGCFYSDAASRLVSQLTHSNRLPWEGEVDVSEYSVATQGVSDIAQESAPEEAPSAPTDSAIEPAPTTSEAPATEENAAPTPEQVPE